MDMTTNDGVKPRDVPELPQRDNKLGDPEWPAQETDAGQRFYEQYKDWVDMMNDTSGSTVCSAKSGGAGSEMSSHGV